MEEAGVVKGYSVAHGLDGQGKRMHDGEGEGGGGQRHAVRASECVEILLAYKERTENGRVFAQSHAQVVDEGEVSGCELLAHVRNVTKI
jgi:hypothetical protein